MGGDPFEPHLTTLPQIRSSPSRPKPSGRQPIPGSPHPSPGLRPDRRTSHPPVAPRGLLICAQCGRKMQGNLVSRKRAEPRVGYRCMYRQEYPGDATHPPLAVRGRGQSRPGGRRLAGDAHVQEPRRGHSRDAGPNRGRGRAARGPPGTYGRLRSSIEARPLHGRHREGYGPDALRRALQSSPTGIGLCQGSSRGTRCHCRPRPRRAGDQRAIGAGRQHRGAAAPRRRRRTPGVLPRTHLAYQRVGDQEKLRAHLGVEFSRVGGGTCPPTTRATVFDLAT